MKRDNKVLHYRIFSLVIFIKAFSVFFGHYMYSGNSQSGGNILFTVTVQTAWWEVWWLHDEYDYDEYYHNETEVKG